MRVYDSTKSTAPATHLPLLMKLTKGGKDDDAAETVVTSGNRMLIEYVTVDHDVSVVRSNEGFIASYVAADKFAGKLLRTCILLQITMRGSAQPDGRSSATTDAKLLWQNANIFVTVATRSVGDKFA